MLILIRDKRVRGIGILVRAVVHASTLRMGGREATHSGLPERELVSGRTTIASMHSVSTSATTPVRDASNLDHGINVGDLPAPHRLAERGW